jgi:hypothetical protein
MGRAGGDGHTSSETGALDWLHRGVASDRRRWAARALMGCGFVLVVWLLGAVVHVLRRTGLVRQLGVRCGRVDVRRTLIVGDAVCSEYAALSDLPSASLRDAGDWRGGRAFEGWGDAGRDAPWAAVRTRGCEWGQVRGE